MGDALPVMEAPSIGVVGVGSLGRHHARVVRDLERVECAGIFDADSDRSRAVGGELGVRARSSLRELIEASDAVVVAVPTHSHETVALEAIEAGVHVFVEKPMAPGVASARTASWRRPRRGARSCRWDMWSDSTRRWWLRGPTSTVPLFVESHRLAPFTPRSLDVAVVLDLMIHDVDLLCSLVGSSGDGTWPPPGVPVLSRRVDIANARVEFRRRGGREPYREPRLGLEGEEIPRLAALRATCRWTWRRGRGEFYRLKRTVLSAFWTGCRFPRGFPALDGLASRWSTACRFVGDRIRSRSPLELASPSGTPIQRSGAASRNRRRWTEGAGTRPGHRTTDRGSCRLYAYGVSRKREWIDARKGKPPATLVILLAVVLAIIWYLARAF